MANNTKSNNARNDQTVEVLYQKMGNRWFAFSLIGEEVFVGSISQEELESMPEKKTPSSGVSQKMQIGNS